MKKGLTEYYNSSILQSWQSKATTAEATPISDGKEVRLMQELFLILAGVVIAVKIALDTLAGIKESAHDLNHRER